MKPYYLISFLLLFFLSGCNSSILDDPSIKITFYVAEDSHVKLTIENSYKTRIATLLDTELFAGQHEVNFDASNLAEGIYFYKLEMKGTESDFYSKQTKYMIMVK